MRFLATSFINNTQLHGFSKRTIDGFHCIHNAVYRWTASLKFMASVKKWDVRHWSVWMVCVRLGM